MRAQMPAVRRESRGRIMIITIDRPAVRNALNRDAAAGLSEAFGALEADDALRAAVLTGAGKGFSSGLDLAEFTREGRGTSDDLRRILRRGVTKPLVAAVEGFAVAGGFELALMCDLFLAAEDARLGLPEVKRSLVANGGGLLRLAHELPHQMASEIALTGGFVSARRMYELGVVNRLVAAGDALTEAIALAEEIATNAPVAVEVSKQIIDRRIIDGLWDEQDAYADPVFDSESAREGVAAFLEKRSPDWA